MPTEKLIKSGSTESDEGRLFGSYEGACAGCDSYTKLDDIGLCEECGAKLDRDMIRERDWERSMTGWVTPKDRREELRDHVIRQHGAELELIAPSKSEKKKSRKRKRRRRGRRRAEK